MQITSLSRPFRKALATNANSGSFTAKIPVMAEPTNDGVIDLTQGLPYGADLPQRILIVPYGLGSEDDVFDMKITGWHHIGDYAPQGIPLWIPTTIGEFTCTISQAVGVVAAPVINTERFADTIIVKSGALTPKRPGFDAAAGATFVSDMTIYSPADNSVGYIILLLHGLEKIEFTYDQTTGTPTTNCLVALL